MITFPDFTLNTNTYYYMMNDKLLRYTDPYTVHIDREFFSENGSLHFFRDYKKEVYKKDLKYWLTHGTIGYKSDFVIENDVVTFSKRLPTSNPIFK